MESLVAGSHRYVVAVNARKDPDGRGMLGRNWPRAQEVSGSRRRARWVLSLASRRCPLNDIALLYYDRHGQPMTMRQWAEKFEDVNYTHIARDVIGPDEPLDPAPLTTVSTFWRGVNHNLRHDKPLIYETLIIGEGYDATGMRYATEKQAREGHRRAVDELRAGRGPRAAWPLAPQPVRASLEGHTPRSAVAADGSSHGRHRRGAPGN